MKMQVVDELLSAKADPSHQDSGVAFWALGECSVFHPVLWSLGLLCFVGLGVDGWFGGSAWECRVWGFSLHKRRVIGQWSICIRCLKECAMEYTGIPGMRHAMTRSISRNPLLCVNCK